MIKTAGHHPLTRGLWLALALLAAAASACKQRVPGGGARVLAGEAPASLLGSLNSAFSPSVASLKIETNNATSFRAKLDMIAKATKSIDVAYYIVEDGYTTGTFFAALAERAQAGVKVRLLMDDNDHNQGVRRTIAALKAQGKGNIEVGIFRPMTFVNEALQLVKELKEAQVSMQTILGDLSGLANPFSVQSSEPDALPTVSVDQAKVATAMKLATLIDDLSRSDLARPESLKKMVSGVVDGVSGLDFAKIAELLKRTHHKLIVVDGESMAGGGRNLWDISNMNHGHPLRVRDKNDLDTDYFLDDPVLAAEATKTFEAYWNCMKPAGADAASPACASGIPVEPESTQLNDEELAEAWKDVINDKQVFESKADENGKYPLVFTSTIQGANLPIAYVENRMFKQAGGDEPSRYLDAVVKLLATAAPTDEILLENAYMVMPTPMLLGVVRALKAGSKVTLITNGDNITDNKTVGMLTRMQMEALLKMAKEIGKGANITYIENQSDEQLHTKATVIGDWLVVGSANADPRSAYLNTENGIIIGPGEVTLDGETKPSAAAAFKEMTLKTVANFSKQKVDVRSGGANYVFKEVSAEELTKLLDVPNGPGPADKVKYGINRALRNMMRSAVKEGRAGDTARKSLFERLLLQF